MKQQLSICFLLLGGISFSKQSNQLGANACPANCAICSTSTDCTTCSPTFYLSGSSCLPCSKPCDACSGSPTNCTTCLYPSFQSLPTCDCTSKTKYLDSSYDCVACINHCATCASATYCLTCASGYYLSGTICLPCSKPCVNCTDSSNNCTSCVQSNTQLAPTCACKSVTRYMTATYTCSNCNSICATCITSATNCLSCSDPNKLPPACICAIGYLLNSSQTCDQCTYPCASCESTITQCLSCASTYTYDSILHTCNCLSTQFEQSGSPNTCQNCTSPCFTCQTTSTYCNSCITGLNRHLTSNTCICDDGYFDDGTGSSCLPCLLPCLNCIDNASKCTSCSQADQTLLNDTCNCPNGYFMNGWLFCQICVHPCQNCIDDQNKCISCASTFYLTTNTCNCLNGYYEELTDNPSTCKICTQPCQNCINSSTHCTSCIGGYQLQVDQCLKGGSDVPTNNCLDGFYLNDQSQCTQCIDSCQQCIDSQTCDICFDYAYKYDTYCIDCSLNCKSCIDQYDKCISCNQNYELIDYQCFCNKGYYEQDYQCHKCDYPCIECNNPTECLKCEQLSNLNMTTDNKCQCEDNYYRNDNKCSICDQPCLTCIQTSQNCLSCDKQQNRVLFNNTCLCMQNYFEDGNQLCKPCNSEEGKIVKSCNYKNANDLVWTYGEECDDGNNVVRDGCSNQKIDPGYSCDNIILQQSICFKCPNDCQKCQIENNEVYCNTCNKGFYLNIVQCVQCSLKCLNCENNASTCNDCRFLKNPLTGQCEMCESKVGYYSNYETNSCYSICGDSYLSNNEECDDGNQIDGDGCNKLCQKEQNYSCENGQCTKIIYPIPQLEECNTTTIYDNIRQFQLTYNVNLNLSKQFNLTALTQVYIISEGLQINQSYEIEDQFDSSNYSALITLKLQNESKSSMIMMSFINVSSIISQEGYSQQIENITSQMTDYYLIDLQTIERVQQVNSLNLNMMTILGIMVGSALLFGGVEIFYNLLDTLQLLSFLNYINIELPYTLTKYFSLFQFVQLSFISDYFNIQQKISSYVEEQKLKPVPQKIADNSINSLFLINGSSIVIVWTSLIAIYAAAKVIPKILNFFKFHHLTDVPNQFDWLTRFRLHYLAFKIWMLNSCYTITSEFFYNGILRAWISTSYDLSFAIVLQLFGLQIDSEFYMIKISSVLSLIGLFTYLTVMFYTIQISNLPSYARNNSKYGAIFEGINRKYFSKYFNPYLLMKRILFMFLLIFLSEFPIYQAVSLTLLSVTHSLFLVLFKPLTNQIELIKQITCEINISSSFFFISILAIDTSNPFLTFFARENLGWCCVSLMSTILIVQILLDFLQQWKVLLNKYKLLRKAIKKIKNFFYPQTKQQSAAHNLFEPV